MQTRDPTGRSTRLMSSYSIEITANDLAAFTATAALFQPRTQVSVTFLPGEDAASRVRAACAVRAAGLDPMPHLAARRLTSHAEVESYLGALRDQAEVDRVFVVAGDPVQPLGPFADARSLIETGLLARFGMRTVGIAGYPQGHPQIDDARLWAALAGKHALLREQGHAVEVITQFGFDAGPMLQWIKRVREAGIAAPIRIGLPGPASARTLLRFAARCGVEASGKVLAKYGLSLTRLLASSGPDALLSDLARGLDPSIHGDVRVHLYPFGGLDRAGRWLQAYASGRETFAQAAE